MPYISPTQTTQDPLGRQRITQEPLIQWYEDFSVTPDIVTRWLSTNGGGGTAPAWSAGQMNLVSGTTVNGFSLFQSRRTFFTRSPSFLELLNVVNFGNAAISAGFPANNYALIGFGTVPGSPTIAAPATDGMFFEMSLTGKLSVVTFSGGTRAQLPDMTVGVGGPAGTIQIGADFSPHRYWTRFRGDYGVASLDGFYPEANVVSEFTSGAVGPVNNTLPITFLLIANGGVSSGLQINASILSDTGRNQLVVNNAVGTYPSVPTNIAYSATTDTAFASVNANRVMLIVSNDTTAKLYLLVDPSGAGVSSATNFTYVVPAGATFEFPNPVSTARVRGFWAAAGAGSAAVSDINMSATGL